MPFARQSSRTLRAGDAVHAVVAGRGPDLALADDEEVAGVGRVDEARCGSSISASSAPAFSAWMQARTQLSFEWLLSFGSWLIGRPRTCGTVARRRPWPSAAGRPGMLHDDDHGRPEARELRMLEGPCLAAAGDHEAGVGVGQHGVRGAGLLERRRHAGTVAADVEVDGARRLEEAVEVVVEEAPAAVVQAEPLPDAVAEHEARVVDRDARLGARHEAAVHPYEDVLVARVGLGFVRAQGAAPPAPELLRRPARVKGAGGGGRRRRRRRRRGAGARARPAGCGRGAAARPASAAGCGGGCHGGAAASRARPAGPCR